MERILGPAPALPVALPTPIGTSGACTACACAGQHAAEVFVQAALGPPDVMTEVLRGTLNISPTVTKAPGDRIQVFVARDVDFRTVYALRVANAPAAPDGNP